jgi:hypothetical protein
MFGARVPPSLDLQRRRSLAAAVRAERAAKVARERAELEELVMQLVADVSELPVVLLEIIARYFNPSAGYVLVLFTNRFIMNNDPERPSADNQPLQKLVRADRCDLRKVLDDISGCRVPDPILKFNYYVRTMDNRSLRHFSQQHGCCLTLCEAQSFGVTTCSLYVPTKLHTRNARVATPTCIPEAVFAVGITSCATARATV